MRLVKLSVKRTWTSGVVLVNCDLIQVYGVKPKHVRLLHAFPSTVAQNETQVVEPYIADWIDIQNNSYHSIAVMFANESGEQLGLSFETSNVVIVLSIERVEE